MEERSLWQFLAGSGVRPRVLGGLEWKLPGVDLTRGESWIWVCAQGLAGRAQPLRAPFLHVDLSGLSKPHCVHKLLLKSKYLHMELTRKRKNQTELNKLGTGNPTVRWLVLPRQEVPWPVPSLHKFPGMQKTLKDSKSAC